MIRSIKAVSGVANWPAFFAADVRLAEQVSNGGRVTGPLMQGRASDHRSWQVVSRTGILEEASGAAHWPQSRMPAGFSAGHREHPGAPPGSYCRRKIISILSADLAASVSQPPSATGQQIFVLCEAVHTAADRPALVNLRNHNFAVSERSSCKRAGRLFCVGSRKPKADGCASGPCSSRTPNRRVVPPNR
jgi:hypothetical protein